MDFLTAWWGTSIPKPLIVQGSTVFEFSRSVQIIGLPCRKIFENLDLYHDINRDSLRPRDEKQSFENICMKMVNIFIISGQKVSF